MIRTEDVRVDLFKLEQKITEKLGTEITEVIDNDELNELLNSVKCASEVLATIVTDEIEDEELEEILYDAGAHSLEDFLPLLDDNAELNSLY